MALNIRLGTGKWLQFQLVYYCFPVFYIIKRQAEGGDGGQTTKED